MNKLDKAQRAKLAKLSTALSDAACAFNAARSEFESFREEIHGALVEYYECGSELWQNSDAGYNYEAFRDAWGDECADKCDDDHTDYPTEPGS